MMKSGSSAGATSWNASSWAAAQFPPEYQFCSEVARPWGFGPLTFAFGGQNLYLPPAYPNIRQPTLSFDNILIH